MPTTPLKQSATDQQSDSSTSSSPSSCSSTPATSVKSMKGGSQAGVMSIDLTNSSAPASDDIVMVEEVATPIKPSQEAKRKSSASKSSSQPKRARLNSPTPTSTPAKSVSATPTATSANPTPPPAATASTAGPSLVELKNGKFVVHQKTLEWLTKPSYATALAAFSDGMVDNPELKLDDWPEEHHGLVAKLIHESDKSEQQIVRQTKKTLAAAIESALDEQDSPEIEPSLDAADRIPFGALDSLIKSLADRVNYGIALSDLPNGLPEGVEAIPAGLQIFRWEVRNEAHLPRELTSRLEKRKLERQQIKQQAVALFLALSTEEQTVLLLGAGGKKAHAAIAAAAVPVPSTPAASTPIKAKSPEAKKAASESKPRKEKVKNEAELAAEAEKARVKAEREEERAAKKREAEREKAEKAAQRAEKEQHRAEEEAEKAKKREERERKKQDKLDKDRQEREARERKEAAAKKQQQMFSSFVVKKDSTPTAQPSSQSPAKADSSKKTDFEATFLPFEPKGRPVAPINKFIDERRKKGKQLPNSLELNSHPSLTLNQARSEFLTNVPSHRLLPRDNVNPRPPLVVREVVEAINNYSVTGDSAEVAELTKQLQSRSQVQIKHLQFHEDHRPGYVGTWTKRSRLITPRTPTAQDVGAFDYSVDSEEEWEEEPEGEDVDNDDEDEGSEAESEVDSWLADDDEPLEFEEGYEGEGTPPAIDLDVEDPELGLARKRIEDRAKKAKSAADGAKKKKVGNLIPVSIGPIWEPTLGARSKDNLRSLRIQFINDWSVGLDPMLHVTKPFVSPLAKTAAATADDVPAASSETLLATSVTALGGAREKKTPVAAREFPAQHWPALVAMVHDSEVFEPVMRENLFKHIAAVDETVKKGMIGPALHSAAHKKKGQGQRWVVKPEFLEKYAPHLVGTGTATASPARPAAAETAASLSASASPAPPPPAAAAAEPEPIVIEIA